MSGIYARRIAVVAASAALAATTGLLTAPTAQAAMPTPVSASTARTYLGQLTVSTEGSSSGYSRDKFPTGSPSREPATPARWC